MQSFFPFFPLQLVLFPGESLNLHIFEDRYKELSNECLEESKPFAIPPFLKDKVQGYASIVEITKVVQKYPNGEMDLKTRCTGVGKVLNFMPQAENKLYPAGVLQVLNIEGTEVHGDLLLRESIAKLIEDLYSGMQIAEKPFNSIDDIHAFKIGHLVGLEQEEEVILLRTTAENSRLRFIKEHLKKIVPELQVKQQIEERIKMNGHFQKPPSY